jgi:hypothetical protein
VNCPTCGASVTKKARFCSSCGARLDAGETQAAPLPPTEPSPTPVNYAQAEPRLFGVVPPVLTLVLAGLLLLLALVMLVAGNWVSALLVLVIAMLLFVLFLGSARRAPAGSVAGRAMAATDRLGGWVGFVGGSAGAWSAAGREVLRLRNEIRGLQPERDDVQFALGDAAYRENASETAALRARLRDLDREIAEREAASAAALERARRRSRRERLAVQPTQKLEPPERGAGDSAGEDVG